MLELIPARYMPLEKLEDLGTIDAGERSGRHRGDPRSHGGCGHAATAEISRSQLWRWIAQRVVTEQGDLVTRGLLNAVAERETISA